MKGASRTTTQKSATWELERRKMEKWKNVAWNADFPVEQTATHRCIIYKENLLGGAYNRKQFQLNLRKKLIATQTDKSRKSFPKFGNNGNVNLSVFFPKKSIQFVWYNSNLIKCNQMIQFRWLIIDKKINFEDLAT